MNGPPPVVEARGLVRVYRRGGATVRAVDGVDLGVAAAGLTAVVGRSGSGKSTLARCLGLLERPDSGEVLLEGRRTRGLEGPGLAAARRRVQVVMQDPARSVNPRFTVGQAVTEPLGISGTPSGERGERAAELLRAVDLDPSFSRRPARQLSGGQIQRLVFARALACRPSLLILDETLSGLDLSLRARLVEVLLGVLERYELSCLLVSHDRDLVDHLADTVITLEAGRVVDRRQRGIARPQLKVDRSGARK